MAGGGFSDAGTLKRAHLYQYKITGYFIFSCIVGALGGALFGYDLGVSGGVTSMDDFLIQFFPKVYEKKHAHLAETDYCKYDDQILTLFTSSLYFAALVSTVCCQSITMLIIGRILLGVGIGFGCSSLSFRNGTCKSERSSEPTLSVNNMLGNSDCQPCELWHREDSSLGVEVIPWFSYSSSSFYVHWRAVCVLKHPTALWNKADSTKDERCWRRLGALLMLMLNLMILLRLSREAKSIKNPFQNLLLRKNRPQVIIGAFAIPAFQQLTGNNSILFYAPVIFQTLGFGSGASLYSSVITSVALVVATLISMAFVDKFGRRAFFLEAGAEMIICLVAMAIVLSVEFGKGKELSYGVSIFLVIVIFLFVLAYGRSWGPLGWLVPSELFPLEIRSAAQSVVVCVNMIFTALVAQFFLVSLCHLKYGIFLLFAALIVLMSCFVFFLLPETKQVPIEEIYLLFENHWFWKRVVGEGKNTSGSSSNV
ncbi:hypothetical protein GYH30_025564 [Glycine max]|nr:hypothetical protein GYH30_025564 [Glycine max]